MNNNYEYILFDLDGTLTDSSQGITKSVQYALKHFNISVTDLNELRKFIGPPLRDSFKEFYNFDDDMIKMGIIKYREYFEDKGIYDNKLYDGIIEILQILKENNKKLILATSKPEIYAKEILKYFNIDKYFTFIAGADLEETRVKKGDVIKYALENCKIKDTSSAIMIGDRKHDILGAKENNLKTIGVLFGFGTLEELKEYGADYIAQTPNDIINIIRKIS